MKEKKPGSNQLWSKRKCTQICPILLKTKTFPAFAFNGKSISTGHTMVMWKNNEKIWPRVCREGTWVRHSRDDRGSDLLCLQAVWLAAHEARGDLPMTFHDVQESGIIWSAGIVIIPSVYFWWRDCVCGARQMETSGWSAMQTGVQYAWGGEQYAVDEGRGAWNRIELHWQQNQRTKRRLELRSNKIKSLLGDLELLYEGWEGTKELFMAKVLWKKNTSLTQAFSALSTVGNN